MSERRIRRHISIDRLSKKKEITTAEKLSQKSVASGTQEPQGTKRDFKWILDKT